MFDFLFFGNHKQPPVKKNFTFESLSKIPKTIWTYWDNPDPPQKILKCIETWRVHNPDFTIVILNNDNLSQFITTNPNTYKNADTPQRVSDFVRLHVLYDHGGIWIDSSSIVTRPLTQHQPNVLPAPDFVGYFSDDLTQDYRYPVVESWFFACPPKSRFVKAWLDEFLEINTFTSPFHYVVNRFRLLKTKPNIPIFLRSYLAIHVAAQVVLQHHQFPLERVLLIDSIQNGPLFHRESRFNILTNMLTLQTNVANKSNIHSSVIKLRKGERRVIDFIDTFK